MYILLRVKDDSLLNKVRAYLKRLGCWVREFNEPEYRVDVTAEERVEAFRRHRGQGSYVNPPAACATCASMKQIWDWDSMGRGPWAAMKHDPNTAPHGKGWVRDRDGRHRVAGECANPTMLNHISCPMWCPKYEPTSIEAHIYVAKRVIEEHEHRAKELRMQIEFLRQSDTGYREVIRTGGVFEYRNGKFVVTGLEVKE